MVANDPQGPIPAPTLPPDLLSAVPARASREDKTGQDTPAALRYTLVVLSPEVPQLAEAFTRVGLLERMRGAPPSTVMGLDQRMRSDLETAKNLLHAHGYYSGAASGKIRRDRRGRDGDTEDGDEGLDPNAYEVTVTFEPGRQYVVGKTSVAVTDPSRLRPADKASRYRPPAATLDEVGLRAGAPAAADAVLDAVAAAREQFRDRGYPFAQTVSTRYTVDHEKHTLDAEVLIDTGPLVYMGELVVKGEPSVRRSYLDALATWEPGRAWSQSRVENFRDSLRQSGLFTSAEISPADHEDAEGRRAVETALTPAPERTVGGALKYDTDFGPGVLGYWQHRNLTGRGDRLRIEAPIWSDLQELAATYRLPFFLRKDQDLIARAAARSENTNAYDLKSATGAIGLERRISRRWSGSLSVMGEGGRLKAPDESSSDYLMAGLPGMLAYNGANSLLDATRGFRVNLALAPYAGEYKEDFTALRARLEAQAFIPVIGEDSLVMAFRGMYGVLSGADAPEVPVSIRYYAGGGGSVRGYEFQSLGPRNESRDPLGGASAVELSAEARVKFNETWGAVAFVDGGMAYNDRTPDFSEEEIRWGAGIGLRFYTVIGPVRLDVATPLNPRKKDDPVHIYFSIGQSF